MIGHCEDCGMDGAEVKWWDEDTPQKTVSQFLCMSCWRNTRILKISKGEAFPPWEEVSSFEEPEKFEREDFPLEKSEREAEKGILEEIDKLLYPRRPGETEADRTEMFKRRVLNAITDFGVEQGLTPAQRALEVTNILLHLCREAFSEEKVREVFKSDLLETVRAEAYEKGREEGNEEGNEEGRRQLLNELEDCQDD